MDSHLSARDVPDREAFLRFPRGGSSSGLVRAEGRGKIGATTAGSKSACSRAELDLCAEIVWRYTGKLDVFKGVVEVDEALHADLREGERGTERWSEDVRKEFSDMSLERRGKRGEGNRG